MFFESFPDTYGYSLPKLLSALFNSSTPFILNKNIRTEIILERTTTNISTYDFNLAQSNNKLNNVSIMSFGIVLSQLTTKIR